MACRFRVCHNLKKKEDAKMIKAGIIGATGYAGAELVRILMGHPSVEIKWYGSRSYIDKKYADVYRNMFEIVEDTCLDDNIEELAKQVDVIFTATPQGFLGSVLNEKILSETKVIDLSADYRIKDVATYEKWYKIEHKSPQFIEEAVYGLCEINREKVKNARLVANPGCYTTCSILTAYPLVKEGLIDANTLIVDAKSGTSGAGRGAKVNNLFCEVNENMKAYGVATHEKFVRVLEDGVCPETKWVEGSNYVDVNFVVDERTGRVIMMGALDNLVKGAAGQAVQNMNLLFGLKESEGLELVPMFP